MNEAGLNESETRAELIDPALKEAGWGVMEGSRVRREVITLGRLQGAGKRGKQDIADYVLFYKGQKLGVIEAKKKSLSDTEGVAQAKRYAERLQTRFTYSTNGVGIYQVDMQTGKEGHVGHYPTPDELWAMTFGVSMIILMEPPMFALMAPRRGVISGLQTGSLFRDFTSFFKR